MIQTIIPLAQKFLNLPWIQGEISSQFSSTQPNHRMQIRQRLCQQMLHLTQEPFREGQNLARPPLFYKNYSISISHCRKRGGLFINPLTSIGFDIEETYRFKKNIYAKITKSNTEQKIELPSLWTLKEASLKALSLLSEKIFLKDILIHKNHASPFLFDIQYAGLKGQGLTLKTSLFTASLAHFPQLQVKDFEQ